MNMYTWNNSNTDILLNYFITQYSMTNVLATIIQINII